MTEREYDKLVKSMMPKSPIGKDCLLPFWWVVVSAHWDS